MQRSSRTSHPMPPSLRLIVAPALALLALGLSACKENSASSTAAPPPAVHVESVTVAQQPMPRVLQLTGNLRGQHETDLAANAAGRVLATFVERGAQVKKGDILAKLDIRAASLGAAEAKARRRARAHPGRQRQARLRTLRKALPRRIHLASRVRSHLRPVPHHAAVGGGLRSARAGRGHRGRRRHHPRPVRRRGHRTLHRGRPIRSSRHQGGGSGRSRAAQARVHRTRGQPLVGQRGQPRLLHGLGLPRSLFRRRREVHRRIGANHHARSGGRGGRHQPRQGAAPGHVRVGSAADRRSNDGRRSQARSHHQRRTIARAGHRRRTSRRARGADRHHHRRSAGGDEEGFKPATRS